MLLKTVFMEYTNIASFIKPTCISLIIAGFVIIFIKRAMQKVITFKEISDWATSECSSGNVCTICILSKMPNEVRKSVRKSNGIMQIVNGYREDTSIFIAVSDSNDEIIKTYVFMGKSLDKELTQALSNSDILRLTV